MRYDSFARLMDSHATGGGDAYAYCAISYGIPEPKLIDEIFQGTICDLLIKTPRYAYQQEYRITGSNPVECRLKPDAKHPGCKIEEYDHTEVDLDSQLAGFPGRRPCRASRRNNTDSRWSFRSTHRQPNAGRIAAGWGNRKPTASYPPQHSPERSLMLTGVPVK